MDKKTVFGKTGAVIAICLYTGYAAATSEVLVGSFYVDLPVAIIPSVNSTTGELSWTKQVVADPANATPPSPLIIKGEKGDQGLTGSQGPTGPQGYTFTPSVSDEGVISWTNNGGLTNPGSVNIKGPRGDTGPQGPAGVVDDTTLATLATKNYVQKYHVPVSQINGGSTVFDFNSSTGYITGVKSGSITGLDNVMSAVNNSLTGLSATYSLANSANNTATSVAALVGDCSTGICSAHSLLSALIEAGVIDVSVSGDTIVITGKAPTCNRSGDDTEDPNQERT